MAKRKVGVEGLRAALGVAEPPADAVSRRDIQQALEVSKEQACRRITAAVDAGTLEELGAFMVRQADGRSVRTPMYRVVG
jgi:hypothetical protein